MKGRVLAVVVAMLVVGLAVGGAAAYLSRPAASSDGVAEPVPGASPAFPTNPTTTIPPYDPDIDYPPLTTPTDFARRTIGNGYQDWRYAYPKGWQAYCVTDGNEVELTKDEVGGCSEVRFRPVDEPTEGGYSLRVKGIDDHAPTTAMVSAKLAALQAAPDLSDVTVLAQTDNSLYVTLRTAGNLLRYNFFAWYAAPSSNEATLEMSVAGRKVDDAGLRGLFAAFGDRAVAQ